MASCDVYYRNPKDPCLRVIQPVLPQDTPDPGLAATACSICWDFVRAAACCSIISWNINPASVRFPAWCQ